MISLLTHPNEALLMIANGLHCCKDIQALRLTNRHLYYLLIKHRLTQSSIKGCHETLLGCTAAAGDVNLAAELLDNLARTQMKSSDSDSQKNTNTDYNNGIDSAFFIHPLFQKGYTQKAILKIQNAFPVAIEANSKQLITLLLDRGARADFEFPYNPPLDEFTDEIHKSSVLVIFESNAFLGSILIR